MSNENSTRNSDEKRAKQRLNTPGAKLTGIVQKAKEDVAAALGMDTNDVVITIHYYE